VRLTGAFAVIGITADGLAKLVHIDRIVVPEQGARMKNGDCVASVEAATGRTQFACPLSGTVSAVNRSRLENPVGLQDDPYGGGWLLALSVEAGEEVEHLLDEQAYAAEFMESDPGI
jgi:glycine cleavage system H protein